MAHLYLQEDPKVSVGGANDDPATIATPEQLGSFLLTYAAAGPTGQVAAAYAALAVGGTSQWVPIAGTVPGSTPIKYFSGQLTGLALGTVDGYLADVGNQFAMSTTEISYPVGSVGFTARILTIRVTANNLITDTTVSVLRNGVLPPGAELITLSIPALTTGEFSGFAMTPFVPGDYFDVLVENTNGGTGIITMSGRLET